MTEREYHGICTEISTKDLQISQTIFIFAFFVKFNEKIEKLFRTPNYLSTARHIRTITFC